MLKSNKLIKPEIRILGLDDASFIPYSKGKIGVIGVVFRGGYWLEDVMKTEITIDGLDATVNISSMITNSPHYQQLQLIMLNGIMFGGFNIVNMKQLSLNTKLPILSVVRKKPVFSSIRKALMNLPYFEERWKAILEAGTINEAPARNAKSKIYFQAIGLTEKVAQKIIRLTSTRSNIPEVLRVAHIVASGIGAI
jgi:endonuclease V-like protein UPF0215 family